MQIADKAHMYKDTEKPSVCELIEYSILSNEPNLLINIESAKDFSL